MTMLQNFLIIMAVISLNSVTAFAGSAFTGVWNGYQGSDRQVAVTLAIEADGTGTGEFRRAGIAKIGRAAIVLIEVDDNTVSYTQKYTDAILDRVTGTTARIEASFSDDGRSLIGVGINIDLGNTFKVELFKE